MLIKVLVKVEGVANITICSKVRLSAHNLTLLLQHNHQVLKRGHTWGTGFLTD